VSDEACVSWCPQCGPGVSIDEDGCCESCGATATGAWASRAIEQAAEVDRLKEERDEAKKKVARYKQAVADQLHADMAEIVGQRDAAEQRTAEVIAAWLDRQYGSIGIHGRIAQNIRAGMWRKEATK
jgi:type 1 glutamine amidotransferase